MNPNPPSGKVEFYVHDVGRSSWEEISVGGTGYEKANYGWREREGPCEVGKTKSDNCGVVDPSEFTDPIYFYEHMNPDRGYAIVGGSFIPTGIWPTKYDNGYLYSDLRGKSIFHLELDDDNECRGNTCNIQKSKFNAVPLVEDIDSPSTFRLRFGPYNKKISSQTSLYHLQYDLGTINRLTYIIEEGNNKMPTAIIETMYSSDSDGVNVYFDGSKSSDRDRDTLTFQWDFGDSNKDDAFATTSRTSHTYTKAGRFVATLIVNDGNKAADTSVIVNVDDDYFRSSDDDYGQPTLTTFDWSDKCDDYNDSSDNNVNVDWCGILEFCSIDYAGTTIYGYKVVGEDDDGCQSLKKGNSPVIRLTPGKTYRLTLRNLSNEPTNMHTHGLHVVGSGNGDDITRIVQGGGNRMDYIWDMRNDHPGGTYW
jgi:hypothetical protein